jgi:hypothetical protein
MIKQELPVCDTSSPAIEPEKTQELLSEINPSTSSPFMNNTNSQVPAFTSTDQQIPHFNSSISIPHFSPETMTFKNPSVPAFQVINSQFSPNQQSSTSDSMKPFVLTPQVTTLPSFSSQESITVSTSQEVFVTSVCSSQSSTTQELAYQSSIPFLPQSSDSQYHPTDIGSTATTRDEPSSKDLSNYFTVFQSQANSSNSPSTIPMFSVKNFPQISTLAQPLGK